MSAGLKLAAHDAEGVAVVSAILQDAILAMRDMRYDPAAHEFILAVSRFCWEDTENPEPAYERVNCAVTVRGVQAAQLQGMDQADKDALHELLAVMLEDNLLRLVFAGGAQMRLLLGDWRLRLEDFGVPWPTEKCPRHERTGEES